MLKKFLGIFICLVITSFYCSANAHGFTWFGLRNNDTEIFISNTEHPVPAPPPHKHHPKKPKPKKHKPDKKPHEPRKCYFWWCK